MTRQDIEDAYGLSATQKGMLFHTAYSPGSGVYVQQMIGQLREPLNVSVFRWAWQQIAERHAVLRTSFSLERCDEPLQQVHQRVVLPFDERDWRGLSDSEQEGRLKDYLAADRRVGFDLANAPLMRLALFHLGDADYRLVWTSHHALFDGRSRLVVVEELFALYEACCCGENRLLAPAPHFRAHVDWLATQDFNRAESFWRRELEGVGSPTPLGIDGRGVKGADGDESHGSRTLRLSGSLTMSLKRLAEGHQLTLNTLLQGAWALLLSRYSGRRDIIFGATRVCRHSSVEGADSMVGTLINTVPVSVSVSEETGLLPWLEELRAKWIAMREYEQTPLSKIQEWSEVPSSKPLFESLLVFENFELNAALRARARGFEQREFQLIGRTNYPLTISGYRDQQLLVNVDYDRNRFQDDSIDRLLGHVETVLAAMVSNPGQRIADVSILTETERQRMLVEWNDTETEYPRDKCIHELFEQQVERTPTAVAVVYEGRQLTYRQLNERSNQLAHYLRKRGVGPDCLVGICMERSPDLIVAILGILKAGGAYVPLDPGYPQERLEFMLADTRMRVLVADKQFEQLSGSNEGVVCLNSDWEVIARECDRNPWCAVQPDSLAYVIYTSGSTGQPKGVAVPHRAVNRLVCNTNYAQLGPTDRVAQVSNCSFDAATFEIWGALLHGACLVGVAKDVVLSARHFAAAIRDREISTLFLTTSLFNQLASEIPQAFQTVTHLLFGGEAADPRWVREILSQGAPRRLVNGYGPTESTTFACWHLTQQVQADAVIIPIGRPISNTQVYLLDARLRPVPTGVTGELYIGGDGLARCYLNRPELTAEKFIPHPFSTEPGTRLYRTGDLGRYLPDGNIEFLGRADDQVKIRGFRIELGEIETALHQHPSVRQAVVLASEGPNGAKDLTAYIVALENESLPAVQLRRFLNEKLPDYMVPKNLVFLESLPLTPNGKLDRNGLLTLRLGSTQSEPRIAVVKPQSPTEETLVRIWRQVLGKEGIGIHDNFFDLGGDSLLAMQVISNVWRSLGVDLPMRQLFDAPTVAGLAKCISNDHPKSRSVRGVPLTASHRTQEIPLSPRQKFCWDHKNTFVDKPLFNICRVLRLRGVLQKDPLQRAFNDLVARHESLRTSFSISPSGDPVQVIQLQGGVTLPLVDLSSLATPDRETKARSLAEEEGLIVFRLSESPLFRLKLIRLSQDEHWLVLVLSHFVVDGWSLKVLFRELATIYTAYCRNERPDLPLLPIQFADYVLWQWQYLRSERDRLVSYWNHQLGGDLSGLKLPFDYPRPNVPTLRALRETVFLPAGLRKSLSRLGQEQQATEFMMLLAAFKALLYLYTGQTDIMTGGSDANRSDIETRDVIGLFSNITLFRSDLSGNPTFFELLNRVRNVVLDSYQHRGLSLELLEVECRRGDSNGDPMYQCRFNEALDSGLELSMGELEVEFLPREQCSMRQDLKVFVGHTDKSIEMRWDYSTDLFKPDTIRLMVQRYRSLLQQIVLNPNQHLSDFSLDVLDRQELLGFEHTAQHVLPADGAATVLAKSLPKPRPAKHASLSLAQQRLWFLDQLEPGSSAYNVNQLFRLRGNLHLEALQRALNAVVARHGTLRTTFAILDGEPVQVIAPELNISAPVVDLEGLPEQQVEAQQRAARQAEQPFDLRNGPLFRATLFRLAETEHWLLLSVHHIVSDGWSMALLQRELSAFYAGFITGEPAELADLPIQYADYAIWQQRRPLGKDLESQLAFWKQHLSGCVPVLRLPTDRPRPEVQTYQGARQMLVLPKALASSLDRLSRQEGCTLFMTLLAALNTLLYRTTLQEDIIVGVPVAGRTQPETEALIGFFVNTLPLRMNLSDGPSFRMLLHRVRDNALEAYSHQDCPFEKLVEELHPERSLSHTPLFQVMLNVWSLAANSLKLPGLNVEMLERTEAKSKFDLTLYAWEHDEELKLSLVYNASLFDQVRMEEFLRQLRYLLEQVVEDPEKPIRSYSLVTPHFRAVLPNPAEELFEPPYEFVTNSFVSWAEHSPNHTAVSEGERTWSYKELSYSARRLALALLKDGMNPGDVVAVTGPKSFGLVTSFMGTMMAGGVLLPLDPRLPPNRQRLLLQESRARRICYIGEWNQEDSWMREVLPSSLSVDPDEGRVLGEAVIGDPELDKLPELSPCSPAYIFFTSGTTGVPKGVLGSHKGLSHFVTWQKETFGVVPQDRCAQLTNLSFDVVLRDIFLPLVSGATICLPDETDATQVLSWLDRQRVTLLHVVPSLAEHWLATASEKVALRSLRWVFFAGEALSHTLVRHWRDAFQNSGSVVNFYGPTETTMVKCFYVVPPEISMGVQPVGKPISQTQALVLTERSQLCGLGEPGEIVLRTPFRTLGYVNSELEGQSRFVRNPFRDDARDVLYFTGDLGRYLPDGSLEIFGRLDDQVKIRGVRIEPGEVTAILCQLPQVRRGIVVARSKGQESVLVAYVVPSSPKSVTAAELKTHLSRQLPAVMVPTTFVFLEDLPLTPNGKVNRNALLTLDSENIREVIPFVGPRNPLEETIAGIWCENLGLKQVGIYDNFFDLGGHSLLAMKLSSKISVATNHVVSVRSLFLYPNIAALTEALANFPPFKGGLSIKDVSLKHADESDGRKEPLLQPSSPYLRIERRALLSLLGIGKIAPVDAAAIGCLPHLLLADSNVVIDEVVHDWYEDMPVLNAITETSLGRIAVIRLPRFRWELYNDTENLLDLTVEALELARQVGARTVSLTGLIPSATEYGRAIARRISERPDLPRITTGHATTAATVALAVLRILEESGRDLRKERVGFLGLGSIGTTALRLMLRCLPHPEEIILCDIYSKLNSLEAIKKELKQDLGFKGSVSVLGATGGIPQEFYESTLIVGATNVPDVLDIERVKEGTLIVDDSAPHCFKTEDAVQRFLRREDILFTQGGTLQAPDTIRQVRYLPRQMEQKAPKFCREVLARYDPFEITGCIFSSLLSACYEDLKPTVGLVGDDAAWQHYQRLLALGFRAFALQCENYILPQAGILNFRRRFGGTPSGAQRSHGIRSLEPRRN